MPNGSDCAAVLQTEAVRVPTQWFVLDATADGRAAGWLRADVPGEIDYLHARRESPAGGDAKGAYVALLHGLFDAYERRRAEGSKGRLVVWVVWVAADLSDALGRRLLAEWPLERPTPLFWQAGVVPAVIRVGVGGTEDDRLSFLGQVSGQWNRAAESSHP